VFTARYSLSPYIKQICFVCKGLKLYGSSEYSDVLSNTAVPLKPMLLSLYDIYGYMFLPARLGMVAVAPVSNVDYTAHLDTQSRPPQVHRGSLHHAHVRVAVCRPITGTQQTSRQGERSVHKGKNRKSSLLSKSSDLKRDAENNTP
jgi:hypothetical protein